MSVALSKLNELLRLLRLILYRMVKRVRRAVSGQCEVVRICGGANHRGAEAAPVEHTSAMTRALWNEWSTSKKLQPIFVQRAKDPLMDVDSTVALICEAKCITELPVVSANLKRCMYEIRGVNQLVAEVKALCSKGYDSLNEEHERKLEMLWQLMLPNEERTGGRYTREWGRIGFQQADPASDFRGGGLLGLEQLLFIATTRTGVVRRMISEPEPEMSRYPWACVGINLTMEAVRILESRAIDSSLYGKSAEEGMRVFHATYADMFELLHAKWVAAKPENILSFPLVLKESLAAAREEIANGGIIPPGAEG